MATKTARTASDLNRDAIRAYDKYAVTGSKIIDRQVFTPDREVTVLDSYTDAQPGQVIAEVYGIGPNGGASSWVDLPIATIWLIVDSTKRGGRTKITAVRLIKYAQFPYTPDVFLNMGRDAKNGTLLWTMKATKNRQYLLLGEYDEIIDSITSDRYYRNSQEKYAAYMKIQKRANLAAEREDAAFEAAEQRAQNTCDALNTALGVDVFSVDWDSKPGLTADRTLVLALTKAKERLGEVTPSQARTIRRLARA